MWQIKNLNIQNLITHKDTTFKFKRNKCITIYAINSTDSGSDSNGGGKSTILEGITLCFTGETNRNVTKDEFIRDGENECYVEINLTNEIGDVNELSIKRWFFRGSKSTKVQIWENGVHNKEITSPNEANKKVFELIGLNKEDLLHFFMIGQETSYSFLTANDTDKKSIISRFSDIEFIDTKIEELKKKKKIEEEKLRVHSMSEQKVENKIEFLQEKLKKIKSDNSNNLNEKIQEIEEEKKDYLSTKKKLSKSIISLDSDILSQNKILDKIVIPDVTAIEKQLKIVNNKFTSVRKDILDTEHTITHLETIEEGKIACPNCDFEFNPSEDIPIEEIPDLIKSTKILLKDFETEKERLTKKKKSLNDQLSKVETQERAKNVQKRAILNLESEKEEKEIKIKRLDNKLKDADKRISELKKTDSKKESKEILNDIKFENNILNELKLLREGFDKNILDYDFWIYHFGKKGFMTFLTNKSIKSIEGVTNSYLKQMNSELQVFIEGYTVLKSGDVREKINTSVVRNGLQVGSFGRYSGGEKGRIKLANIIGLQHLINLTAKNGGLNFLGLDEVFEGLDRTGQIDVLNILENLKITSIVITHRNQPIGASNEVFIEKLNGVSRIVKKVL